MTSTYVHPLRNVKFIYKILMFSVGVQPNNNSNNNSKNHNNNNNNEVQRHHQFLTPKYYLDFAIRLHSLRMINEPFQEVIVFNLSHLWRTDFDRYEKETLRAVSLDYNKSRETHQHRLGKKDDENESNNNSNCGEDVVSQEMRDTLNNSVPFPFSFEDDVEEFADLIS